MYRDTFQSIWVRGRFDSLDESIRTILRPFCCMTALRAPIHKSHSQTVLLYDCLACTISKKLVLSQASGQECDSMDWNSVAGLPDPN